MKKFTLILFPLIFAHLFCMAQEYNVVTISANGARNVYTLSDIQRVAIEDKSATDPKFSVVFKNGIQPLGDIKTVIIELDEPTISTDADDDGILIYSKDKTIVVSVPTQRNILFYNIGGIQIGNSVATTYCECTVTHSGVYLVRVDDKYYKIRIN